MWHWWSFVSSMMVCFLFSSSTSEDTFSEHRCINVEKPKIHLYLSFNKMIIALGSMVQLKNTLNKYIYWKNILNIPFQSVHIFICGTMLTSECGILKHHFSHPRNHKAFKLDHKQSAQHVIPPSSVLLTTTMCLRRELQRLFVEKGFPLTLYFHSKLPSIPESRSE